MMKKIMMALAMIFLIVAPVMALEDIVWGNDAPVLDWLGNGVTDGNSWLVRLYESTDGTINFSNLLPNGDDVWSGASFTWGGLGVDGYTYQVVASGNTTYGFADGNKIYSVIFNSSSYETATRWAVIDDALGVVAYTEGGYTYNPGGTVAGDWQAVPEPATVGLMAIGGGLAWLIRLKQRIG